MLLHLLHNDLQPLNQQHKKPSIPHDLRTLIRSPKLMEFPTHSFNSCTCIIWKARCDGVLNNAHIHLRTMLI